MTDLDRAQVEQKMRARCAIECALITLKFFRSEMTEGQLKELKRLIYAGDAQ
jgi:DNA-binding GntR family transcriptional regulator